MRCAHQRYPYFEFENAEKVLKNLNEADNQGASEFLDLYREQKRRSGEHVNYYELNGHKSEIDRLFEENYTSYSDNGIMGYIQDILALLVEDGILTEAETGEYNSLMQTYF